MSKRVSIRYLIDIAIGNPELGVVNFNALYRVLQAISEKLDLQDDQIEIDSSFCPVPTNNYDSKSNESSEQLMNHQVYDILPQYDKQDQNIILDESHREDFQNKNLTDSKKTHRSVSLQNQHQTAEERKVAFGQHNKNEGEEILSRHEVKKLKNLDIKQQIDCVNERLEKIENFSVRSVDTEQGLECLRQIVQQLQGKMDILEKSVCELSHKLYDREEYISACRIKKEYDKLSLVTDGLKKDINVLKELICDGGSNNIQISKKLLESPVELAEIERLDVQLMELKTNICIFNQKLVNLEEIVAKTDKCSPMVTLDLFVQEIASLKTQIEISTTQLEHQMLEEIANKLEVVNSKIGKAQVDELLSEKADYSMLHRKVSVELLDAKHLEIEKQLAEITDCVNVSEEYIQKQIDDIKKLVGDENLKDMLHDFKSKISNEIQGISNGLKRLSEIKPDIESTVTKLKDLTCLSCDQDVVMRTVVVNNLTKFSDAYVSKSISPSVTFEIKKLRDTAKIGLFNDDGIISDLENKFRFSGGVHTVITNSDRISKTRLRKRK